MKIDNLATQKRTDVISKFKSVKDYNNSDFSAYLKNIPKKWHPDFLLPIKDKWFAMIIYPRIALKVESQKCPEIRALIKMQQVELMRYKGPLLLCGIISSVLYAVTDILAGMRWTDYDYSSQTVSELFAIDAPSRSLVIPLFIMYSFLIYLFGLGVWLSANSGKALKISAVLIVGKEILGLIGTLFAPIHMRGVAGTLSDTMHGVITGVGVLLCMFPAMIFGAIALSRKFRIYSIITMVIFLVFGSLAGMAGKALAANQPTPWLGIWERINIYGYMIWIIVFALVLLKARERRPV